MTREITRRAALAAVAAAPLVRAAAGSSPIRLGGPIFLKSDDPAVLAREHRRLGYSAAYCPNAKATDTDRCKAIEKAYKEADVVIAEVGAWVNMMDPDAETRKKNLAYVAERLALAEAVAARCCVDIAGSYNPKVWYGPHKGNFSKEFFDGTVENCRKLIDEIKPKRTKFTIEMMGWIVPDTADAYLRLIKAVDRPAFAVHIDVCNGINSPQRFYENAAYIRDCFTKLGKWVMSCHAKDLAWIPEMNVHFVEVIPGRGEMDYRAYLSELAKLPQAPPLMLEHLKTAEEYEEGKNYILRVGKEAGLAFA
ncbi:MAG: TIM barrel protein [Bryobacteraceae bacterium]|nr:TIM barrel protein [Bryobacteraceae bacterium]